MIKLKSKKEIALMAIAVFLLIALAAYVIFSVVFLISRLNSALKVEDTSQPSNFSGFNVEGFKDLNLGV